MERSQLPLEAYCQVRVEGQGELEMEEDYIPHVITCENGNADFEALKAQAVAARSYAYYKLRHGDVIADGQSDQVYSCRRDPGEEHFRAVRETAGQVLMYQDVVIAAFYVAGAIPSTADCVALDGDRDPTGTEHYVTYNSGLRGDDLVQTTLGWVNSGNLENRGCQSQNGAHCLAQHGSSYEEILRFYYGEDIILEQSVGDCLEPIEPPPNCQALLQGELLIDDDDPCFSRHCSSGDWWDPAEGLGGQAWTTGAIIRAEPVCYGEWRFEVEQAGHYQLEVYLEDQPRPLSHQAPYTIRHAGQEELQRIDQERASGWTSLGSYHFQAGGGQWVRLGDNSGEEDLRILFDALRLRPDEPERPDAARPPLDAQLRDMGPRDLPPLPRDQRPPRFDQAPPPRDLGLRPPQDQGPQRDLRLQERGFRDLLSSHPDPWQPPASLDTGLSARPDLKNSDPQDFSAFGERGLPGQRPQEQVRQRGEGCQQGGSLKLPLGPFLMLGGLLLSMRRRLSSQNL